MRAPRLCFFSSPLVSSPLLFAFRSHAHALLSIRMSHAPSWRVADPITWIREHRPFSIAPDASPRRPKIMTRPDVDAIFDDALLPSSPPEIKSQVLLILSDLLRADEEKLSQRQSATLEDIAARAAKATTTSEHGPLAKINGTEDTTTLTGSLMHRFWDAVLSLATEVARPGRTETPAPTTPGAPLASPSDTVVRWNTIEVGGHGTRFSSLILSPHLFRLPLPLPPSFSLSLSLTSRFPLQVMEHVLRGGLVAPWTSVPHLMALATDPTPDIAARSLKLFQMLADRHPTLVDGRLIEGLELAFSFHISLARVKPDAPLSPAGAATPHAPKHDSGSHADDGPGASILGLPLGPTAVAGIGKVYAVARDTRGLKTKFLAAVAMRLEQPCIAAAPRTPGAARATLPDSDSELALLCFLARAAADLPFRRADEPLFLLHALNRAVSRRGELVASSLSERLGGGAWSDDEQQAPEKGTGAGGAARGAGSRKRMRVEDSAGAAEHGDAVDADLSRDVTAAGALCVALALKGHLKRSYRLADARISAFEPTAEGRRAEERLQAVKVSPSSASSSSVTRRGGSCLSWGARRRPGLGRERIWCG